MASIIYREIDPGTRLADHVLCLWEFRVDPTLSGMYRHHVIPDGCVSVVHRRPGPSGGSSLVVMGPRLQEFRVDVWGGDEYCGVKLWPDAAGPLLGLSPATLLDRVEPLALHAPALADPLSRALNECPDLAAAGAALLASLRPPGPGGQEPDPVVRRAVSLIVAEAGQGSISGLAGRLGLGHRQLQRRFREAVGLTPKQFARVRRLRASLAGALDANPNSWAGLAARSGFADQAHLAREIARLTGLTPGAFREHHRLIQLEDVDP